MNMREGMRTPWGKAQSVTELAPGIHVVDTAGHGGVKLDRKRQALLPALARKDGAWYEEDVDALVPVLMFFDEIKHSLGPSLTRAGIADSIGRWNPGVLAVLRTAGIPLV